MVEVTKSLAYYTQNQSQLYEFVQGRAVEIRGFRKQLNTVKLELQESYGTLAIHTKHGLLAKF
jgi:hypothetical protein